MSDLEWKITDTVDFHEVLLAKSVIMFSFHDNQQAKKDCKVSLVFAVTLRLVFFSHVRCDRSAFTCVHRIHQRLICIHVNSNKRLGFWNMTVGWC